MENIRKEYDAIIDELAERALLIASENKEESAGACAMQAIDDGFFYTDDKAYVLAFMLENGVIKWGADVDWQEIMQNVLADVENELIEKLKKKGI